MDIIYINELKVPANLGVYSWEKRLPQTIEINLEFAVADQKAGATDSLADTIDYASVTERIQVVLATHRFELLEALAECIANLLLHEFGASWTKINVAKLGVLRNVKRVGIIIERRRV
ncbi:MAG: dihydroneopterin aldolase [Pseudomonadota bacterium]